MKNIISSWKDGSSDVALKAKDVFMLFLLVERWKGKRSFYFHYIHNVPPAYGTPSYVPDCDVDVLPGFLREERDKQMKCVSEAYLRICRTLKMYGDILAGFVVTKADVRWAWHVINTRSVYFDTKHLKCRRRCNLDLAEVNFALLPILDLLNHNDTANIDVYFDPDTNRLRIITNDSYKRGDQVFINYGAHGNRALLAEYGFVLPNNIHSQIPLTKDLLLKHTTSGLDPSLVESLVDTITQRGVSLGKMCLTQDGFDWGFITAAHSFLALKQGVERSEQQKQQQCRGFSVDKCSGVCIVGEVLRCLLVELMEDHASVMKKIEERCGSSSSSSSHILHNV